MALSEREQRILEEIETALAAEGPIKVVDPKARSFVFGVLIVLVGLALLLTAVIMPFTPLGVVAFIVMLAGVLQALNNIPLRR